MECRCFEHYKAEMSISRVSLKVKCFYFEYYRSGMSVFSVIQKRNVGVLSAIKAECGVLLLKWNVGGLSIINKECGCFQCYKSEMSVFQFS